MNPLDQFLVRVRSLITSAHAAKKPFIEIVKQESGIELKDEEVSLRDGLITLQTSSGVKNEIFMRKSTILELLSAQGFSKIRDIR